MKTIKPGTKVILSALILFSLIAATQITPPDAIIGTYNTEHNAAEIQIYKKNDAYFGMVVSGNEKVATGTIVLKNLTYKGNCWKGKVFAPARHSDFDCTITMANPNALKLVAKAGPVTKEQKWTKL
jgi:uncharacterized protein (DUF2147 family)